MNPAIRRRRLHEPHHRGLPLSTLLAGSLFGGGAALAMYLWQQSVELTGASYVIVGYTTGYWFHLRTTCQWSLQMMRDLKRHSINRVHSRIGRMLADSTFWVSLLAGAVLIPASAWYAGLRDPYGLAWVAGCWSMIALMLNFEMTVLFPTTRCRKCDYQLLAQFNPEDPQQVVRCPECGTAWSKSDLFVTPRMPIRPDMPTNVAA